MGRTSCRRRIIGRDQGGEISSGTFFSTLTHTRLTSSKVIEPFYFTRSGLGGKKNEPLPGPTPPSPKRLLTKKRRPDRAWNRYHSIRAATPLVRFRIPRSASKQRILSDLFSYSKIHPNVGLSIE